MPDKEGNPIRGEPGHFRYKKDMAAGKYNPIIAGKWDYEPMSRPLIESIERTITPDISAVYTVQDALKAYWKN